MSKQKPVPLASLSLGDYLRWLATTVEYPTNSDLVERASRADALFAACEAALPFVEYLANTGNGPASEAANVLYAAIAKAKGQS